ncbi:titin-like [Brevipalpus obovatus]|uniref:titin-like n=1 Tax=Brevipalpus obovatus TaxID=246614 RepID=UPI003D9ECC49
MLSAGKVLSFLILIYQVYFSVSNESPKLFTDQLLKFNKKAGEAVFMSCKILSGSLPVRFEWFKDNVPVQTSKRILIDSSQRKSDLELNSLESSDTGAIYVESVMSLAVIVSQLILTCKDLPVGQSNQQMFEQIQGKQYLSNVMESLFLFPE